MNVLLVVLGVTSCVLYVLVRSSRQKNPLPPGPKPDPIIGNVRHMKKYAPWLYYTELKKEYGDIVHLKAFAKHIIVLNSFEAIQDLVVRKASTFSDRPRLVMCGELVGWEQGTAICCGPRWAISRKLLHQFLSKSSTRDYFESIQEECRLFLARMINYPDNLVVEFRLSVAKIVLRHVYGLKIKSFDDDFVRFSDDSAIIFGQAAQPGSFLVDTFPALKYVPSWLPGAGFKRKAAEWKRGMLKGISAPHEQVKKDMAAGVALPSFTSRALENLPDGVTDELVMWTTGSIYGAAVDTTTATVCTFILAMILHPDVQRKAQKEVEAVVGTERLPNLLDRPDLPYVECLVKEVMRWEILFPTSLPYASTQDAVYKGYFIPKGSVIIANSWAISHDEKLYPSPEKFIPERFEGDNPPLDPRSITFGYGKRLCPGMHLSDAIIWITITSLLATVDFSKAKDKVGNEITPVPEYFNGGLIREVKEFPYAVRPLSAAKAALVHDAAAAITP